MSIRPVDICNSWWLTGDAAFKEQIIIPVFALQRKKFPIWEDIGGGRQRAHWLLPAPLKATWQDSQSRSGLTETASSWWMWYYLGWEVDNILKVCKHI